MSSAAVKEPAYYKIELGDEEKKEIGKDFRNNGK